MSQKIIALQMPTYIKMTKENLPSSYQVFSDLDMYLPKVIQDSLRHKIHQRLFNLQISLVIPTYNDVNNIITHITHFESQIKDAIAIRPEWKFEILVVINGRGRQETVDVLMNNSASVTFPHLKVVDCVDIVGKVNAMNFGASIARQNNSDILAFIDPDMEFTKGSFFEAISFLTQNDHIYLTGIPKYPRKDVNQSYDMYSRLQYLWLTDQLRKQPKTGGGNMFMLTATYPTIPTNIISDGGYLEAYFSTPDDEQNRPNRVMPVIKPGFETFFELQPYSPDLTRRHLKMYRGYRQLINIFGNTKMNSLMRRRLTILKFNLLKALFSEPLSLKQRIGIGWAYLQNLAISGLIQTRVYSSIWYEKKINYPSSKQSEPENQYI